MEHGVRGDRKNHELQLTLKRKISMENLTRFLCKKKKRKRKKKKKKRKKSDEDAEKCPPTVIRCKYEECNRIVLFKNCILIQYGNNAITITSMKNTMRYLSIILIYLDDLRYSQLMSNALFHIRNDPKGTSISSVPTTDSYILRRKKICECERT